MEALLQIARDKAAPRNLVLEAIAALGVLADARAFDALLDMLTDPWPAVRAALITAAAKVNPEGFLLVASGVAADPDWSVRAALASALAALPADQVAAELADLTKDADPRVQGPALRALGQVGSPDLPTRLFQALKPMTSSHATAAALIGEKKPGGAGAIGRRARARTATRRTARGPRRSRGWGATAPMTRKPCSAARWPTRPGRCDGARRNCPRRG